MSKLSAADMFALNKRESASNFPNNQKNKSLAKMLSGAVASVSVMLATQLEANAEDETRVEKLDGLMTASLGNPNITSDAQNVKTNAIEDVLGSATQDVAALGIDALSVSALAQQANQAGSIRSTAFGEQSGRLPRDFVSEAPGVTDPAQQTDYIGFEQADSARVATPSNTGGSTSVAGLRGEAGEDGHDGADGRDGIDGKDGTNGRDGIDGKDGANGRDGIDGINGANGEDGIDGIDGANGRNGIDGIDGTNGRDGANGEDGTNGLDGRDGVDGLDGKTVFLLDGNLLEQPGFLESLDAQGLEVQTGPFGTVSLTLSPDQLEIVNNLITLAFPDELENGENADGNEGEEEFLHLIPFSGSDQEDLLIGTEGNDILSSFGANDILIGGLGADTLLGGDGSDTASYETSNEAVFIDLSTGDVFGGEAEGDTFNSVENLIGSNFDDVLIGDNKSNHLTGGQSEDALFGGDAYDILHGGANADLLDGGASDDDLATYFDSDEAVSISLTNDTASGGHAEGDELFNIESLNGSLFDDFLQGDQQANRLGGLFGEDVLLGEAGNDTLLGGHSGDLIDGGEGSDTSDYTASLEGVSVNLKTGESRFGEAEGDILVSIENLAGSAFDDTLAGDDGINRLTGRDGDDMLIGHGGNDRLVGGLGADHHDGGEGDRDAADYSAAEEAVGVDLVGGGFAGEATGDTFDSIEFIVGSEHHDNLLGNDAINRINGGDGCDVIFGRGGNDTLIGEAGNDILNGGSGNDVFIFSEGDGNDIIEDFEAGAGRTDRLRLLDSSFEDFEDVQSALTDTEDGALLTLDNGSILLQNLNSADLVADDFILG